MTGIRSRELMSRRSLLERSLGAAISAAGAALSLPRSLRAGDRGQLPMIVRNRRPLDLETPVTALDEWLTPDDKFFIRSHFGAPAVGQSPWNISVTGLVDHPLNLTPDDLAGFAPAKLTAVLQCSGNGRANFQPGVPGVSWDRGAVGQAEWTGVRLVDVLKRAGYQRGSAHVHCLGADGPPSPKTPAFFRSIPLEKAVHPDTILATEMNGDPLPVLHGGPVRLVVPGWFGNNWMKWVRTITVSDVEAPGFYMQTGYRIPRTPAPPDAVLKPGDLVPVTLMNVKSLITSPGEGSRVSGDKVEVRGVAWTGDGTISRVDVAVGADPHWKQATLLVEPKPWSWCPWIYAFAAEKPGKVLLRARATDSRGETQPESTPWNRSGYLWNGIDRVTCEVA